MTSENAGFVVGRNVEIEYRFSEGHNDQLSALATELIQRPITVLVATDRPSSLAAKAATTAIPIVFHTGDDPVRSGLVQSFWLIATIWTDALDGRYWRQTDMAGPLLNASRSKK